MSWASNAQDFHFSQFMENMVYVNPAYVALPVTGEVGLTYRNQWPGIPATFVTYGATAVVPVKTLHSGIGASFLNDMQGSGVINRTSASILYAYMFRMNSNWQVRAGIGASYVIKKFNADQLVFKSDILNDLGYSFGQVTMDNYSKSYPDFNVGFMVRNKKDLSFGFSASHLTRPRESFSDQVESRLPVKYTAFVSGRMLVDNKSSYNMAVEPAFFYSRQQQNQELIWGSHVIIANSFMVGGWVRQNLRFNFESVIVSAGISWDHYNISYSYDVNLKKISFLSAKMAAHEVTFLYRFEYNEKKFKKVECPAYL
jgi:type IX secretion system PorP/SprF family membrane protein